MGERGNDIRDYPIAQCQLPGMIQIAELVAGRCRYETCQ